MTVATRLERLAGALDEEGCRAYVSDMPVDVRYFTGSEDSGGVLVVVPGQSAVLIVRESAADHARDTVATGIEVHAYPVGEHFTGMLAQILTRMGLHGKVATAGLQPGESASIATHTSLTLEARPDIAPRLRRAKEPEELAMIRHAAAIADMATAAAMAAIRVGATELEAAAALESTARRMGCEGDIRVIQVKGGPRAAYPDALASARRFTPGELGYVDLAVFYRGYLGDMTRAFTLGEIGPDCRRILETVDQVQLMARGMLRPGVACRDLYLTVREAFVQAGYAPSPPHHLGHGVGLAAEHPRLAIDSADILQVGDVFSVEPGLYVHGVGGVRIEDIVVLNETGVEVLSQHPRITTIPV